MKYGTKRDAVRTMGGSHLLCIEDHDMNLACKHCGKIIPNWGLAILTDEGDVNYCSTGCQEADDKPKVQLVLPLERMDG